MPTSSTKQTIGQEVMPTRQRRTPGSAKQTTANPPEPPQAVKVKRFTPPPHARSRQSTFWRRLQVPLIIFVGIALGIASQSVLIGQGLTIVYGLISIIIRTESRVTFLLAGLSILTTILLLVTQHNTTAAHNFASYAFLLLLFGIIGAAREVREQQSLLLKDRGPQRFAKRHK